MRKVLSLLLAALLLFLCGCARLFEKEYVSTRDYDDPEPVSGQNTQEIHDYNGLTRLLNAMVGNFKTEQSLIFTDYDGIIADDLSKACWELRSDTALGAYCVRDIEYTIEQVVAYCEADVTVSYKRSEEEVKGLKTVQTRGMMSECIADALENHVSKLAVLINSKALTESDVADLTVQTCLEHPLYAIQIPEVDVTMYSGETSQRIYEIALQWPLPQSEEDGRREALEKVLEEIASELDPDAPDCALKAAAAVSERCTLGGEIGSTAYDALVLGQTDSQGLAMAYRAVCDTLGIGCSVVNGQYDSNAHVWNIVTIAGKRYHIDLTSYSGTLWLQPDQDIWGRYWWNTDRYPACTDQGFSWQPGQVLNIPE